MMLTGWWRWWMGLAVVVLFGAFLIWCWWGDR